MINKDTFANFSPQIISAVMLNSENVPKERISFGRRTVVHYELELIVDGTGEISTDGNMIKTQARNLFFRTPGMEVEGFSPYYSYFIVFKFNKADENPLALNQLPLMINAQNMQNLLHLFKNIYEEFSRETEVSELIIKSCISNIMVYIIEYSSHINKYTNSGINRAASFIKDNYTSDFTLEQLSKISGYSIHHFTRLFKKCIRCTPVEYINELRINCAKNMLVDTNGTIEYISQKCGFTNTSYFYRTFKRFAGTTPSEYRKKMRVYDVR
jgi:AraC-like DNA-binding protein